MIETFKKYINEYYVPLNNESEKEQLAAVKQDGRIINLIDNPSEKVKFAAVLTHGPAIRNIKNQSEELQKLSVKDYGAVIQFIDNPFLGTILQAIKTSPEIIEAFWFPWTIDFQKWFIKQDSNNILKIPKDRLDQELAIKYKYLINMTKAGILS